MDRRCWDELAAIPGKREGQGAPTSNGGKYGDCRERLSYVQQYPAVAIIAGTQSDARARISNDQDFALTRPRYLAAGRASLTLGEVATSAREGVATSAPIS